MQSDYLLRTRGASDVDEHAHNLSAWEQQYDQLAPGRFIGTLAEFWTPDAQVFRERTSHAVRQACCVWDDALWFGIPIRHDGTRINACEMPEGAVLVHAGGAAFELHTPSDHEIFGVVVRREAIEHYCENLGAKVAWSQLACASWIQTSPVLRHNGVAMLQALFAQLASHPVLAEEDASRRTLGQTIMGVLLPFLEVPAYEAPAKGAFARRRKVVEGILAEIKARPDWVPTVPELCERFHLSRRSLQYAFEEVLGLSPLVFLRTLRLNGVRRMLSHPTVEVDTVQRAAAAWGFWHLGQFGQDYQRLFGERPSESLAKGLSACGGLPRAGAGLLIPDYWRDQN